MIKRTALSLLLSLVGASGALALSSGQHLTATPAAGSALLTALPAGGAAWSASAWVKCASPSPMVLLAWGAPGASSSPTALSLAVSQATSSSGPAVCDGTWRHLAVTYPGGGGGGGASTYFDGGPVTASDYGVVLPTLPSSIPSDGSATLRVGWNGLPAA